MTAASSPIGVGVIGLGFIGRIHAAAYQAARQAGHPCRLVAVCDRNPDRRRSRSGPPGNLPPVHADAAPTFDPRQVRWYTSADQLLADPLVELVSICTYTDTHVPLAIQALQAGKHVLVEKPLALSAAAADPLLQAARQFGRVCMPAMCMRFWPGWRWLRERIDKGTFGAVRSAVFTRLAATPDWAPAFFQDPARSGGALFDLHVHDVDFAYWCFGPPRQVVSTGSLRHVTTLCRYDAGPQHVVAEGGWIDAPGFPFRMRYLVEFEQAAADFDLARQPPLLLVRDNRADPVELPALSGYDAQVRHLLDCLTRAPQRPDATLEDAVAVLHILEAERRSLDACTPVEPAVPRRGQTPAKLENS